MFKRSKILILLLLAVSCLSLVARADKLEGSNYTVYDDVPSGGGGIL